MAYRSKEQMLSSSSVPITPPNNVTGTLIGHGGEYITYEFPRRGELGGEKYPHWMIFYINDHVKVKGDPGTLTMSDEYLRSQSANMGVSDAVFNSSAENKQPVAKITNKNGEVSNYYPTGSESKTIFGDLMNFKSKPARINKVICLPMPASIRANYDAEYTKTDDVSAFGAILSGLSQGATDKAEAASLAAIPAAVGGGTELIKSGITGLISMISTSAAESASRALNNVVGDSEALQSAVKKIVSKTSGKVINKRQETLFENMAFRQHAFSFLFVPRSLEESNNVTAIIQLFKEHMHPELNGEQHGASLLIVPSEFNIEFRHGTDLNSAMHRIATSALVHLDVNYTPIGEFVAFEGTPNPVAISLDLLFREMEPLNRTMIKKYGF